ncbi:MAG: hypothetical protein ACRC5C_06785, partial [Bacilli bacterium]
MRVLMVGFNGSLLESLSKSGEKFVITVLEESVLYEKKKLHLKSFPVLQEVLFGEYQQSNSYLTYIEQWKAQSFDAVVAGLEYAVPASNHIAEQLGLPHGGVNVSI